jgi:serine protease Do
MGNPFGLGGSASAGIVSARGRDIGAGPYDAFIQVDAPINRGNSGGPLFTQDGKVVGVNTAILSPTGGSIGIGFAIPSNMVKTVVAELETNGHVTRGFLGVAAQPVTADIAKGLKIESDKGALVASVEPNSPAEKAGVQPGDVIVSVDGKEVKSPHDLAVDVAAEKPGSNVSIALLREGQSKTLQVAVAEMPNDRTASTGSETQPGEHHARVGLALAPLTPDVRGQLDLPEGQKGAVVANVVPGSPADEAGIQPGDVVVGVGSKPVTSPDEAVKAIRGATKGKHATLALRILRDGHTTYVAVPMGESDEG